MLRKKATTTASQEMAQPSLALRPAKSPGAEERTPFTTYEELESLPPSPARSARHFWILGLVLLGVTIVGGIWAIQPFGNATTGSTLPDDRPPAVSAIGLVDSDPGIVRLYPPQAGEITELAGERDVVKGTVLLRLDDRLAQCLVQEAQAALEEAKLMLAQAEKAPQRHRIELEQQKNVVEIAQLKLKGVSDDFEIKSRLLREKVGNKQELEVVANMVKAMEKQVEVEQGNLRKLELRDPKIEVERARQNVAAKSAQLRKAQWALDKCKILAPCDGAVLRVHVHPGEILGPNAKGPAIEFCPKGRRIVRAEVLQEWASQVQRGQKVVIEDDTHAGAQWTGTVRQVSDWFTHKRNLIFEPFMVNDVRTLECVVDVDASGPPLRVGQRVRVMIRQD
jgi:multidrug resistance efflux pump